MSIQNQIKGFIVAVLFVFGSANAFGTEENSAESYVSSLQEYRQNLISMERGALFRILEAQVLAAGNSCRAGVLNSLFDDFEPGDLTTIADNAALGLLALDAYSNGTIDYGSYFSIFSLLRSIYQVLVGGQIESLKEYLSNESSACQTAMDSLAIIADAIHARGIFNFSFSR